MLAPFKDLKQSIFFKIGLGGQTVYGKLNNLFKMNASPIYLKS